MTPAQRITVVRGVADALALEDYSIVDLTLEQFGFATKSTWGGSTRDYVIACIKGGNDDRISAIGQYFDILPKEAPEARPAIEPNYWREGFFRLFLSHLAREREYTASLQTQLLDQGVSCFVAHNDIEPTREWEITIEEALSTCDSLGALLHEDFHKSLWTDQEIGFAMGRKKLVFAVLLGEQPYGFIGRFQAFKGTGKNVRELAGEIAGALRRNKVTAKRMADATVSLFEQSGSYAGAAVRARYLADLAYWNEDLLSRVNAAAEQNGQISGSWDATPLLKALREKWATPPPN